MKKIYITFLAPLYLLSQDLNQLVDLSLNNSLIQAKQYSIQAVKKDYDSLKGSYLPKLSIGVDYSKAKKESPSLANNSLTSYAKLDYTIYNGGKKQAQYDTYDLKLKASKQNLQALKNDIVLEVINHYFTYESVLASKEASLKKIEQLQAQYKRLEKFLEAGTTTSDELDKIESTLENTVLNLHQLDLDAEILLSKLNYLTSKSINIKTGSKIIYTQENKNDTRADIKALELKIKEQKVNTKIVKSSNYPLITLNNTFNNYDVSYDNKNYDNNLDHQNILRVNLSWKIFDFNSTKNSYESSYKTYKSIEANYNYEKNKADIDLSLAKKSYIISKLKINTAKAALRAATSTYSTIEAKYKNGLVDNIAYLQALSEKFQAISLLKSAKYDLEIKKANILYQSGKNLWEYIQ